MPDSQQKPTIKEELARRAMLVEKFIAGIYADNQKVPSRLSRAMRYSLEAGGKRIRPVLCITCASICGLGNEKVLPFAAAIEMIHTYSLIHDDLPAMDNDDLRRGKPSNHKAFDEATAILAGDGLLTDAFWLAARSDIEPRKLLSAIGELAHAAGSAGMVGGQVLDMLYTGQNGIETGQLEEMQAMKTGAILRASCLCGAMLAGADKTVMDAIGAYGTALGRAFQIADDILDVTGDTKTLGKPVGSDEADGKNTWPTAIGLEASRKLASQQATLAKEALKNMSGPEVDFLRELADYTVKRVV